MKTKKVYTNLDFCVKSNLTVEEMIRFQKTIGIVEPIDKFLSAKCDFTPKFKVGDILVGSSNELNLIVYGYNEDDFTYSLFETSYINDFHLGGYRTTVRLVVKKAYELETTHTCWGCIKEYLVKNVDVLIK